MSFREWIISYKGGVIWFTVNSEIFARILFSPIALKDIFAAFKLRN